MAKIFNRLKVLRLVKIYILISLIINYSVAFEEIQSSSEAEKNDTKQSEDYPNITQLPTVSMPKKENYTYYNAMITVDAAAAEESLKFLKTINPNDKLSCGQRKAITVELKFNFPFYGHIVKKITVACGGFLYTGGFIHPWLASKQYIAPLMTNFGKEFSNDSFVRYYDNGTAFSILWENMSLQEQPEVGQFTFSVILHNNGDIKFMYHKIPININTIQDDKHSVKVGLSDAYLIETYLPETNKSSKILYEYPRINLNLEDVQNNSIIYLRSLPTCLDYTDCESCSNHRTTFDCGWCPGLNKCSNNGIDRRPQDWLHEGCDKTVIKEGNLCPTNVIQNNDDSSLNKISITEEPSLNLDTEQHQDYANINQLPADFQHNEIHHTYYNIVTIVDEKAVKESYDALKIINANQKLSSAVRKAITVKLKFGFPFYGHLVNQITVASGGFIYTGEYVHPWLAAKQYIAPLMTVFDTSLSNDSFVRYDDNGTTFSILWENVLLQNKPDAGQFTFSATLHNNGDIKFMYHKIPININTIINDKNSVKVGLSDAYLIEEYKPQTNNESSKILYEYPRINLNLEDVQNNSIIYLRSLPTCLDYTDCESCSNHRTTFDCGWCPGLNKCSNNGIDRRPQDWLQEGCDKTVIKEGNLCPTNVMQNNDDSSLNETSISEEPSLNLETEQHQDYANINQLPADFQHNEIHHTYYNIVTKVDEKAVKESYDALKIINANQKLSSAVRKAITVKLKFGFPFYGHIVNQITVASGGFIYTGEYVHPWLAAKQYIAPLMTVFDTSLSNDSFVRYDDNGTTFNILWENVLLQDKPDAGQFTFSAILHNNGDITFMYHKIPININTIRNDKNSVKVGLSDAYLIEEYKPQTNNESSKILYEYPRINLNLEDVQNNSIIYLRSLPTCLDYTDCESCSSHRATFDCGWCPGLNKCSNNGIDRRPQDWLQEGCDKTVIKEGNLCPTNVMQNNDDSSLNETSITEEPSLNLDTEQHQDYANINQLPADFQHNEIHHTYYNIVTKVDEKAVKESYDALKIINANQKLSSAVRKAITVKLKFGFPFYGHIVNQITVASGGFIYTGEYVHPWLAAKQYIAPLMTVFDTSLSNDSFVRYDDNGTTFNILWENVLLQNKPDAGQFTFSATLHNNGDIKFMYHKIPINIDIIPNGKNPAKVGLSDAYLIEEYKPETNKSSKILYEYPRINLNLEDVQNNSIIYLRSLPTCLDYTDCESCSSHRATFDCGWCPGLNKCSNNGIDRRPQDWLQEGCDKTVIKKGSSCPTNVIQSNDDSSLNKIDITEKPLLDDNETDQYNGYASTTQLPAIFEPKEENYAFYKAFITINEAAAKRSWDDLKNMKPVRILTTYRKAIVVELKFDFPFFGYAVRNITIASGGFIYTGEYVHSWTAATQYIAPLMANFDTSLSNESIVRYEDNGTAYNILWENMLLRDQPEVGQFTFGVTLHDNGDIKFTYHKIPINFITIRDDEHPVKVGLSDAYPIKTYIPQKNKSCLTLHEYHRINLNKKVIQNNLIIYLKSLPTCLNYKDCESCTNHQATFDCGWCPSLNKCSNNGLDRRRQDWLQKDCKKNVIKEENSCPAKISQTNEDSFVNTIGISDGSLLNSNEPEQCKDYVGTTQLPVISEPKEENYTYYKAFIAINETAAERTWDDLKNMNPVQSLTTYKNAITIKLKFDFPFYGYTVRNITIASGGFIYTGEYVHAWITATQYIAPLMANFDPSLSNESVIRDEDNGTAYSILWENMLLRDQPEVGQFTFGVTLHDNGDIKFTYHKIPIKINLINNYYHPVKVGLSDAYFFKTRIPKTSINKKTIYEYHRVNLTEHDIQNNSIIYLKSLPDCLDYKDCESCTNQQATLGCGWCPSLNTCSKNGLYRRRQDWLEKGCDKTAIKEETLCRAEVIGNAPL